MPFWCCCWSLSSSAGGGVLSTAAETCPAHCKCRWHRHHPRADRLRGVIESCSAAAAAVWQAAAAVAASRTGRCRVGCRLQLASVSRLLLACLRSPRRITSGAKPSRRRCTVRATDCSHSGRRCSCSKPASAHKYDPARELPGFSTLTILWSVGCTSCAMRLQPALPYWMGRRKRRAGFGMNARCILRIG